MTDLGTMNMWPYLPDEEERRKLIQACPHVPTETLIGHCLTRVSCEACGWKYEVDHGD